MRINWSTKTPKKTREKSNGIESRNGDVLKGVWGIRCHGESLRDLVGLFPWSRYAYIESEVELQTATDGRVTEASSLTIEERQPAGHVTEASSMTIEERPGRPELFH